MSAVANDVKQDSPRIRANAVKFFWYMKYLLSHSGTDNPSDVGDISKIQDFSKKFL